MKSIAVQLVLFVFLAKEMMADEEPMIETKYYKLEKSDIQFSEFSYFYLEMFDKKSVTLTIEDDLDAPELAEQRPNVLEQLGILDSMDMVKCPVTYVMYDRYIISCVIKSDGNKTFNITVDDRSDMMAFPRDTSFFSG